MIVRCLTIFVFLSAINLCLAQEDPIDVSGVYPHLAVYNGQGECGVGAVVPWNGDLWVITYSPHYPDGSDDKLYQIDPDLSTVTLREESIGGTAANRMIHPESAQLFIGPYAIDTADVVRSIAYDRMPGRHTGNARHLHDPDSKIYYATMEEGLYEVDVRNLEVREIYVDQNGRKDSSITPPTGVAALPGAHGKGLYSGQGVVVYSNNGEGTVEALKEYDIQSGVLAEWDGVDWKVIRRNQFVEVTGPGGISGNKNPDSDPIWVTGWDHKSLLLGVRNHREGWKFVRLPKASHSYDGAHGWNTEWPRIRDVGTAGSPDLLMTMHGMFWHFPHRFDFDYMVGIRPRSSYLKVIGDFTRWQDRIVFGCDDSAQKEFLNKRKFKGNIEGPGQSNSNLWFTSLDRPSQLGPNIASGAVWYREQIDAGEISSPFLFNGWQDRMAWIFNHSDTTVSFSFQVNDGMRHGWQTIRKLSLPPQAGHMVTFLVDEPGEWIRAVGEIAGTVSIVFNYSDAEMRTTTRPKIFDGLANIGDDEITGGLLYGLGDDRRQLAVSSTDFKDGEWTSGRYFEFDDGLALVERKDNETKSFVDSAFSIPKDIVKVDEASVLIIDDQGRRWRLPLGHDRYTLAIKKGQVRTCREVATERDLFNCHGTFYELPAENADGFAKIRPISSHNLFVHDYASYRGLLIMSGVKADFNGNPRIFKSEDDKAALWAGVIDDLWQLGKPTGNGGPWKDTEVKSGVHSDPYLIGFYDQRELSISHTNSSSVTFKVEVDPIGHGLWIPFVEFDVMPERELKFRFPSSFEARWIRFSTDNDCQATVLLNYF